MNLKSSLTTIVLLVLVFSAIVLFRFGPGLYERSGLGVSGPEQGEAGSSEVLERELTPQNLRRIEVIQGERRLTLERAPGGDWTLPGKWPTRKKEVQELVDLLTNLRSRFAPMSVVSGGWAEFGLDNPAVIVQIQAGAKDHKLSFAEKAAKNEHGEDEETNRFSRPTFLRLNDNAEAIRLKPGLIAVLDKPIDYYQQHRLFAHERVSKDSDSQEKVDRLDARALSIQEKKPGGVSYTLTKVGDDWELSAPVHDRVDPDKLKNILVAVADIWVEQFVNEKPSPQPDAKPRKDLGEAALKTPEQIIRVTTPKGDTLTLLIGKQSQMKVRMTTRPSPPGLPTPPQKDFLHEEYRYAKLQDNQQIFEIKAEKLKDLLVAVDTLRDDRLARFRSQDVRQVEVIRAGQNILLVKDKDRWLLKRPFNADAESNKVTELLDKLAGLQARDKDILDKLDPMKSGLDKPAATLKVTAEEEIKEDGKVKNKKTSTFTFLLGKRDLDKAKLYVRLEGWDRVNVVEDSVWKLVERSALAYRGRRILDFSSSDLAKIEVQRSGERFRLEQENNTWQLTAPVKAEADLFKANQLADDLGRLEVVEYVNDTPKPQDLDKLYGLARPVLSTVLSFTKTSKRDDQTLLIGKQRGDKPEYFAKLASKPEIFAVKKDVHDALDRSSLSYRPLQLWRFPASDIVDLRIRREGQLFLLKQEGPNWRIVEPFQAPVVANKVQPMVNDLANLTVERFEAHSAQDLKKYGLDQPFLHFALETKPEAKDKPEPAKSPQKSQDAKHKGLVIGKPTAGSAGSRYAKLEGDNAIFVLGSGFVGSVDHTAFDFLDTRLLAIDPKSIQRVSFQSPEKPMKLQRAGTGWQVEANSLKIVADFQVITAFLRIWSNFEAVRFVAYGAGADAKVFNLHKPVAMVTIQLSPSSSEREEKGKIGQQKAVLEHTLAIGGPVPNEPGARYARLDNGPGIFILPPAVASQLTQNYLAFVDRAMFHFEAAKVQAFGRRMNGQDMEILKREDTWHLSKPSDGKADDATVDALLERLSGLRGSRVAAYQAKDLQPFGLDEPAATLTISLAGAQGKSGQHLLKIGKIAGDPRIGAEVERYAQADNSPAVTVIPGDLVRDLLAGPLHFRDRNLARITADIDRAIVERGPRRAVFAKVEGTWKLTSPIEAEAEQADLEDFINAFSRLRADDLVAHRPDDLKAYGLDRPEVRWRFQVGDKEVLGLLIGGPEPSKDATKKNLRRYAKLTGGDLIFLLDSKLADKALAEYRTRTLWSSLDPAQVESMAFRYPDKSFVLQKIDNTWQVKGKPDVQVKSETVSDTLDALARLKAERYVVDTNGDLKLYGLEPPEMVVEIQAPSGNRVLHIGRTEGNSKRHYARIGEGNHSEVFIIADGDAAKIVRALKDFRR